MATGASFNMAARRSSSNSRSHGPSKNSAFDKAVGLFNGLSKRTKIGLIVFLALSIAGLALGYTNQVRGAYVDLYPLKMSRVDVQEISRALTERQFPHTVSPGQDQVLVEPTHRLEAQAYLMSLSLPRSKPPQEPDGKVTPRTRFEQLEASRVNLENQLAFTIRELESVADARVSIAVPERSYLSDDKKTVKASVFLKMAPGFELDRKTSRGVISMVAHSVPELSEENVMILDHLGFDMVSREKPENFEQELEREEERYLREKLQEALSKLYGPDRVHAIVDLSLDFSQEERRVYTPGSPTDDGMVKDSIQLVHEMLEGGSDNADRKYDQRKEAVNYKYVENYFAKLRTKAKVERLTAIVMVDGASESEVDTIMKIVKGGIGIDETNRNDEVYVSILPWNHRIMGIWDQNLSPVFKPETETGPSPMNVAMAVLAAVFGCALAGFLMVRRYRPFLGVDLGGGTASEYRTVGIVDSHHNKGGWQAVLTDGQTKVSRTEALERIVGTEPSRAADILRSTWLS